jgi:hypothetical protein
MTFAAVLVLCYVSVSVPVRHVLANITTGVWLALLRTIDGEDKTGQNIGLYDLLFRCNR